MTGSSTPVQRDELIVGGSASLVGVRLARGWSRAYTYRLPADVARDRQHEIAADVHDQLADAEGVSAPAISRAIATRVLLGIPADLSWRSEQSRAKRLARRNEIAMSSTSSATRNVALALGVVVVGWGLTMATGSAVHQLDDPGAAQRVVWILFAAAALAGLLGLTLLARHRAGGAVLLAVAALGTTLPFYWLPPIWMGGIVLAAFFITFGVRRRGVIHPPLAPPIS